MSDISAGEWYSGLQFSLTDSAMTRKGRSSKGCTQPACDRVAAGAQLGCGLLEAGALQACFARKGDWAGAVYWLLPGARRALAHGQGIFAQPVDICDNQWLIQGRYGP